MPLLARRLGSSNLTTHRPIERRAVLTGGASPLLAGARSAEPDLVGRSQPSEQRWAAALG
jgi:hypothetical protein